MIQYGLKDKVISLIKHKFEVEETKTEKGIILIIENKDELPPETRKTG